MAWIPVISAPVSSCGSCDIWRIGRETVKIKLNITSGPPLSYPSVDRNHVDIIFVRRRHRIVKSFLFSEFDLFVLYHPSSQAFSAGNNITTPCMSAYNRIFNLTNSPYSDAQKGNRGNKNAHEQNIMVKTKNAQIE